MYCILFLLVLPAPYTRCDRFGLVKHFFFISLFEVMMDDFGITNRAIILALFFSDCPSTGSESKLLVLLVCFREYLDAHVRDLMKGSSFF